MNRILFAEEYRESGEHSRNACEYWTLFFCTGGGGAIRLENGTVLPCRRGDLAAIPPGERYTITSEGEITGIRLTMEEPSFSHNVAFRISDDNGSLRTAFRQAAAFCNSPLKHGELVLAALGDLIAGYILVLRENKSLSQPVEQIRRAILGSYSRTDFSPDQVISRMPFHSDYLRKRFKQELGQSPLEFMTALRMEQAGKLLSGRKETGYTVARIARMCGYEDALYFSRVFKKQYGCTPTAFSRGCGKGE